MTSGDDVRRVTRAINAVDGAARVSVRLHLQLVRVVGARVSSASLVAAVAAAGYDAVLLDSDSVTKW